MPYADPSHPSSDPSCPEASTCTLVRSAVGFEALIADLSSRFVNLPPDDLDREIEDALRRVCEPLGIDLAVLWQWSAADPAVILPTHAYDAQNALPPNQPLRQEQFPWVVAQIMAGRDGRDPLHGRDAGGVCRRPGELPSPRAQGRT